MNLDLDRSIPRIPRTARTSPLIKYTRSFET